MVDLEDEIRAWIDTWNDNPRPFTWTKTADQTLNSLAKYLSRISGAGHYRRAEVGEEVDPR